MQVPYRCTVSQSLRLRQRRIFHEPISASNIRQHGIKTSRWKAITPAGSDEMDTKPKEKPEATQKFSNSVARRKLRVTSLGFCLGGLGSVRSLLGRVSYSAQLALPTGYTAYGLVFLTTRTIAITSNPYASLPNPSIPPNSPPLVLSTSHSYLDWCVFLLGVYKAHCYFMDTHISSPLSSRRPLQTTGSLQPCNALPVSIPCSRDS